VNRHTAAAEHSGQVEGAHDHVPRARPLGGYAAESRK
jgi:hypothetical protein